MQERDEDELSLFLLNYTISDRFIKFFINDVDGSLNSKNNPTSDFFEQECKIPYKQDEIEMKYASINFDFNYIK